MARFDLYRNTGHHADTTPYLLDVQSNHLQGLATRVVIPLRRRDTFAQVKLPFDLTPVFVIEDIECFLDTPKLAAIPARELGSVVVFLGHHQSAITGAIDRLFGAF
ncbi:MAG: plasmid maintenance protein CcdB [Candidimonas sp.]|nr:MAG: plasmid maintenance protein CcdB [Candidimonas sp.]TAM24166.1 MAG: plasmid maintenance protein CcdB [Candidimonas sp.]